MNASAVVIHYEEALYQVYACTFTFYLRALDLQSTGRGFDPRPPHCPVATLDKSFTRAQHL